jgi:hypothetical protein
MKKIFALLITLGLLLAVFSVAQAQNWVVLWWADGGTFTIPEGETAELAIGWKTCNGGLTKAFMNATHIEINLDGELLYEVTDRHDLYWDIWPAAPTEDCIPDANAKPSMAAWFYPMDLPPGEYEISFVVSTDHQLTDGFYDPVTGTPAFYDFVTEGTFTLIFE